MSAGSKWLPKPKRPVDPHPAVLTIAADHCSRCGRLLEEAKYHDCAVQLQLPLDAGPES